VPLEVHASVDIRKFSELIEGAPVRCFCEHGNELSVSIEMGSFLVWLSGLTVTQEGLSMKKSDHYILTHSSRLHQNVSYVSF
jgi:hypothetical protein